MRTALASSAPAVRNARLPPTPPPCARRRAGAAAEEERAGGGQGGSEGGQGEGGKREGEGSKKPGALTTTRSRRQRARRCGAQRRHTTDAAPARPPTRSHRSRARAGHLRHHVHAAAHQPWAQNHRRHGPLAVGRPAGAQPRLRLFSSIPARARAAGSATALADRASDGSACGVAQVVNDTIAVGQQTTKALQEQGMQARAGPHAAARESLRAHGCRCTSDAARENRK